MFYLGKYNNNAGYHAAFHSIYNVYSCTRNFCFTPSSCTRNIYVYTNYKVLFWSGTINPRQINKKRFNLWSTMQGKYPRLSERNVHWAFIVRSEFTMRSRLRSVRVQRSLIVLRSHFVNQLAFSVSDIVHSAFAQRSFSVNSPSLTVQIGM